MAEFDEVIANLAPDSLLRSLSTEQLGTLLRAASRRELASGDVIITQGDPESEFAVLLLSGVLKVAMVSASGREIILNYCAPGELVGEIALLDSGPRTASVSAAAPSSVLILSSSTFVETLLESPGSAVAVMRELARRVRQQHLDN